jgi:hypothetical protein
VGAAAGVLLAGAESSRTYVLDDDREAVLARCDSGQEELNGRLATG